jgi:membrane protease YdiL (CAAX protease family)
MKNGFRPAQLGLVLAVPLSAFAFRASRPNFWLRMLAVSGSIGVYALAADADLRHPTLTTDDVITGTISAAVLYGAFRATEVAARHAGTWMTRDIASIYRWRRLMPPLAIAAFLAGAIAPSEELFWRGLVQSALQRRLGTKRGLAAAAACYATAQAASGNATLVAGAAAAGAFWGAQYVLQRRLAPVIVSHIIWDLCIFLLLPARKSTEGNA